MSKCDICYEIKSSFETLHDNHRVCIDCYKRLQAPTCPFCRVSIKLYQKPVLLNKYRQNVNINTERIERRLKRNRRKNFESYDEYLQHRRKIRTRYKDAHLIKMSQ
jgi:hypothetical protein